MLIRVRWTVAGFLNLYLPDMTVPRGLSYVDPAGPGISRVKHGSGFTYRRTNGRPVREASVLARIRSLAIPPAWTDVWICSSPNGHLQATGRDARGRKQYRYHSEWTACRSLTKFDQMSAFAASLPAFRRRVEQDLTLRGLPRRKVLALVCVLLQRTLIRIGNDEYARHNASFGLTTMRDRHAQIKGMHVRFHFKGKSGKVHDVTLDDKRLVTLIRRCRELPGSQLFQYVDDQGAVRTIDSGDVNAYLRETMGATFTAKDFRTWSGTMLAYQALQMLPPPPSKTAGERQVVTAVTAVAGMLGNTRAVCRKSYIHPAVIEAYLDGGLPRVPESRLERGVLAFLQRGRSARAA
jgi:DNA topoisomerase-1